MTELIINTSRDGYSTDQIERTMTVGDLIAFLEDFDPETPVYTGHDNCYTYGPVREDLFEERDAEEEEEEE